MERRNPPQATDRQARLQRADKVRFTNICTHQAADHLLGNSLNHDVPLRVSCECGRHNCDKLISLPFETLREIRENYPKSYIIIPNHLDEHADHVHQRTSEYLLVDKS